MKYSMFVSTLVTLINFVTSASPECYGRSDSCSNPSNYHQATCNLKWQDCADSGKQIPGPFDLCTHSHPPSPSGRIATDAYTLTMQENDFSPSPKSYTLHGLWPDSQYGSGAKNQPYGCLNGDEFDKAYLTEFDDLFNLYWPTDPKYRDTPECFIISEWMKHGTCAVIPGARDETAFRLTQEAYYRTALVLAHEYNENDFFRQRLGLESLIDVKCVKCAYFSTVGWTTTDKDSVPRMSSDCVEQCFPCGKTWTTCPPANLDSTVENDTTNAPQSSRALKSEI